MLDFSSRRFGLIGSVSAMALTLVVFGCNTDRTITGSIPVEYRERHPIRFSEGEHSIQLLIGSGRGDLTATQRAQVTAMASSWRRSGTGILFIEVPKGGPNERAAKYAAREAQSLLRAAGVPPHGVRTRTYQVAQPDGFGPLRIAYAHIVAEAGPCGDWPEDIGVSPFPSLAPLPPSIDNRPHWNFGCATQANLAAAVANPEDLIQPRAETPAYAARRQTVIEKYRKGDNPSGKYDTEDAKASDVGAQ
jgi:pilus assembly protein CpaD